MSTYRVCLLFAVASTFVGCANTLSPAPEADTATAQIANAAVDVGADDFSAVLAAVGDARVVFLGEPSHGDGAAIALRAELVRALHDRLGFDVLAFESDFFAVTQEWESFQRGGDFRAVRDGVQPYWSASAAAAPLWGYIQAEAQLGDTLHVAAFDTQVLSPGSRTMLPGFLRHHLTVLDGANPAEVETAVGFIALALGADGADPSMMTEKTVPATLRLLTRLEREAEDPFAAQVGRSLYENIVSEGNRDPGMGDNLLWLLTERYPDRKVIVWAHNNHIVMDKWAIFGSSGAAAEPARRSGAELARWVYAGEVVRNALGPDATYSIATVSHGGRYSSAYDPALRYEATDFGETAEVPLATAGTVESALAARPGAVSFIDLRPFRGSRAEVETRVLRLEAATSLALRVADAWDGLLFVRQTHGLNEAAATAR